MSYVTTTLDMSNTQSVATLVDQMIGAAVEKAIEEYELQHGILVDAKDEELDAKDAIIEELKEKIEILEQNLYVLEEVYANNM